MRMMLICLTEFVAPSRKLTVDNTPPETQMKLDWVYLLIVMTICKYAYSYDNM